MTVIKFAPMGDPMELQVHGYELTLRLADADQIEIEKIDARAGNIRDFLQLVMRNIRDLEKRENTM